jgi:5S rRNA maturation endonuclease (ribonuclease M5)
MWIGDMKNGQVQAWNFVVKSKNDLETLKNALAKAMIETKTRNLSKAA